MESPTVSILSTNIYKINNSLHARDKIKLYLLRGIICCRKNDGGGARMPESSKESDDALYEQTQSTVKIDSILMECFSRVRFPSSLCKPGSNFACKGGKYFLPLGKKIAGFYEISTSDIKRNSTIITATVLLCISNQ
jgi:hypothetical protein